MCPTHFKPIQLMRTACICAGATTTTPGSALAQAPPHNQCAPPRDARLHKTRTCNPTTGHARWAQQQR
eukprot:344930-Chlamydomonas_euryale.AAC.2